MTMALRKSSLLASGVMVAALILTGCGSNAANEQAVENAIQNANPSVDADVKDGGAGITATDKDGNEIGIGTAAKVPSDFPSSVPLPTGDLKSSVKSGDGNFVLIYRTDDASGNSAAAAYGQQLVQAGFTLDSSGGAASVGGVEATGNGFKVEALSLGGGTLSVSVSPAK